MALTDKEKRQFLAPALLGVLLLVVILFNWYLSSHNRELQVLLHQTNAEITENQVALTSLEDLDVHEAIHSLYRLNDWIPLFSNEVAVRLYIHQRLSRSLGSASAREIQLSWSSSEQSDTPNYTDFILTATFPSFGAMIQFLEQIENTIPPLQVVGANIDKDGITINADVTIRFNYRLEHETV